MVQLDLNLEKVLQLGNVLPKDEFKGILEQFTKEEFIEHSLKQFYDEEAEGNLNEEF